jgi:membrane protein DedA with SNARE-associated domain
MLFHLSRHPYAGLYGAILVCSFWVPFSKTIIILAAGILASKGVGSLYLFMLVAAAALVTADGIYFTIGYLGGEQVLAWRIFARGGFRESLRQAEKTYRTQEWWAVFTARFTPFVRVVIFLVAGLSRMSLVRFLAADLSSAVLFVPAAMLVGYFFPGNRRHLVEYIREGEFVAAVLFLVVLALFFLLARRRKRVRQPEDCG